MALIWIRPWPARVEKWTTKESLTVPAIEKNTQVLVGGQSGQNFIAKLKNIFDHSHRQKAPSSPEIIKNWHFGEILVSHWTVFEKSIADEANTNLLEIFQENNIGSFIKNF